jgi:hypothetical protein
MARLRLYNRSHFHRGRAVAGRGRTRRRARRLWARLPDDVLATLCFGALFLGGVTALLWNPRSAGISGSVFCVIGVAGLTWRAWLWRLQALEQRRLRESQRLRSERREARRHREALLEDERRTRAAADASAHQRAKELQRENRFQELNRENEAEARRRERAGAIAAEAERLQALDDSAFLEAVAAAFEARGFTVLRPGDETACDLTLSRGNIGVREIATVLPQSRRAGATDVRALDACRDRIGAGAAWLVGAAGFNPAAVRAAASLPVTLADPYLLAQWTVGGRTPA